MFGYAYVCSNGQLVVDSHASDDEHLMASATRASQPMYDCRMYVRDVIPTEWIGRHGKFTVRRTTALNGDVLEVAIAFDLD